MSEKGTCYFCGFSLPKPMYEDSQFNHKPGCPVRTALGTIYYAPGTPEAARIVAKVGQEHWNEILLRWYESEGDVAGRIRGTGK